jgi:Tfp pilus assembly protein PilF
VTVAAPKTNPPPAVAAAPSTPPPAEVVQVNDTPEPKPALDTASSSTEPPPATQDPQRFSSPTTPAAERPKVRTEAGEPHEKKHLTLNPASWFKGRKRNVPPPTPVNSAAEAQPQSPPEPQRETSIASKPAASQPSTPIRRYTYQNPAKPTTGNRRKAESYFAQAVQAHHDRRLGEAVENYRQAINLDPGFFEAHYNLGLADYELKDLTESLSAYETALSINPTSVNARYNFALALEAASYYQDAANELEKLLEQRPDETRCHFSLASLYAERLEKPELARPHYRRVLELEPAHPKAGAIRYWLAANP